MPNTHFNSFFKSFSLKQKRSTFNEMPTYLTGVEGDSLEVSEQSPTPQTSQELANLQEMVKQSIDPVKLLMTDPTLLEPLLSKADAIAEGLENYRRGEWKVFNRLAMKQVNKKMPKGQKLNLDDQEVGIIIVEQIQRRLGVKVDGKIGPETLMALLQRSKTGAVQAPQSFETPNESLPEVLLRNVDYGFDEDVLHTFENVLNHPPTDQELAQLAIMKIESEEGNLNLNSEKLAEYLLAYDYGFSLKDIQHFEKELGAIPTEKELEDFYKIKQSLNEQAERQHMSVDTSAQAILIEYNGGFF